MVIQMYKRAGPHTATGALRTTRTLSAIRARSLPHLQRFVTAADVHLVDEDIRDAFLSSHLEQHVLVVGSILWAEDWLVFTVYW